MGKKLLSRDPAVTFAKRSAGVALALAWRLPGACLALGLVVGGLSANSWAAGALNAGNTKLAAEKISASIDYHAQAVHTAYQPGGPVAASTTIRIKLINGKFNPGDTIDIEDDKGNVMGQGTVAAAPNNTYVDITLTQNLASGSVYTIMTDGTTHKELTSALVPAGSEAGTVVSMVVDNKDNPGDPNVYAKAPVVTVENQFSAELKPVTSKIDFDAAMKKFVKDNPMPTKAPLTDIDKSEAGLIIFSDDSINDKIQVNPYGANGCGGTLNAGDGGFKAKITGNLDAVSKVDYNNGAVTQDITSTDQKNGYVTLSVDGNQMQICKKSASSPIATPLTLTVSTNKVITPDTKTIEVSLTTGNAIKASRDLISAGTPAYIWKLNATQVYIPLVGVNPDTNRETYIKIQSDSKTPGANGVNVQVLCSDGSVVTYNAGSVTPGKPMVITGSQLKKAAEDQGKEVGDSFAAIVTVNAPEKDVFVYANIIDPSGAKRVPCKVVGGKIVE